MRGNGVDNLERFRDVLLLFHQRDFNSSEEESEKHCTSEKSASNHHGMTQHKNSASGAN